MIIRATQKLLKNIKGGVKKADEVPAESFVSEWYADVISATFKGKMVVVYLHAPTYMVVIAEGKTIQSTYPKFLKRLEQLMVRFQFPEQFIEEHVRHSGAPQITKTGSRSILGVFNQIKSHIDYSFAASFSYEEIDFEYIENVLMDRINTLHNSWLRPMDVWDAYFKGEDLYKEKSGQQKDDLVIKLKPNSGLTKEEDLYMENEIMKMEIEQRLGGSFATLDNEDINPELENLFLKHIKAFEERRSDASKTTPHALIKNVKFPESDTLTEYMLGKQYRRLVDKLEKVNIVVNFLGEYSVKTQYDFIRNELLPLEIDHFDMPGMIHGFIYEEFHPNHELDLENLSKRLLTFIIEREMSADSLADFTADHVDYNGEIMTLTEFMEQIKLLEYTNHFVETTHFRIEKIEFDEEFFHGKVAGYLKEHLKSRVYFTFNFIRNESFWGLVSVDLKV
ncbi:hypothetical protein GC194_02980 [bacterium]|nr:hypothetical protein [bacterium]